MKNPIIEDIKAQFKSGNPITRLIVINVAVFIIVSLLRIVLIGNTQLYHNIIDFLLFHISFGGLITMPWTIITYMFTHEGLFHLVFNMLWLYWFGQILASYIAIKNIIPLYIMGGIVGALFALLIFSIIPVFQSSLGIPMLGASAGVSAIIIATATLLPNFKLNMILIGPIKLVYIAIFFVFLNLLDVASQINIGGNLAHLGGALMGYIYIVQYKKGKDLSKWMNAFLDWTKTFFKLPSKSKLRTVHRRPVSDVDYTSNKVENQKRVDMILDKISKSGYESLSSEEREFLFKISNKK